MNNVTVQYDPELVEYLVDFKPSKNNDDANYSANLSFVYKMPVSNMFLTSYGYEYPPGKPSEKYKIFEVSVDACKLLQRRNRGDVIFTFLFDALSKFGKMPRSCPIKAVSIGFECILAACFFKPI